MFNFIKNWLNIQPRWVSFKKLCDNADTKKKKWNALVHLSNGLPNITYPFTERNPKTGQKLRWEAAYNEASKELRKQYGREDKAMKSKVFWWRQLWHLLGGIMAAGVLNASLTGLLWVGQVIVYPLLGYGVPGAITASKIIIWATILRPWLSAAIIGILIGYKEFVHDISVNPYKNYLDTAFWILGALIWTLLI